MCSHQVFVVVDINLGFLLIDFKLLAVINIKHVFSMLPTFILKQSENKIYIHIYHFLQFPLDWFDNHIYKVTFTIIFSLKTHSLAKNLRRHTDILLVFPVGYYLVEALEILVVCSEHNFLSK